MSTLAPSVQQATRLNLLQEFELHRDGETTPLAPSLQRLVCFLAFQPNPARRAYVSGTLWPATDEQHAGASLRSALWRLHPHGIIGSSNTHLWLDPLIEVDLHVVAGRALAVLRTSPSDQDLLTTARQLVDVGDHILPGWYEEWVISERERFRQLRLHALDQIGERLIQRGRWHDALQVALAVTSAEPLRESAHRLLVRVHLLHGNVAEALRQYMTYSDLIRDELNARPSPVIRGLVTPYLYP